jgi:nitrate reductase gamma subunit
LAAAALAALWPGAPSLLALFLLSAGGFLMGQASIPDPGPTSDRIITMAGSFIGAAMGLTYLAGGMLYLRRRFSQHWVRIALRAVAAWIAAIALLMLALASVTAEGVSDPEMTEKRP